MTAVCEECGKQLEYGRHCQGGCKTQHTPTYFLDGQYLVEQDAQSGNTIADIRADDDVRQMILRAVNAHEELLGMVKELLSELSWACQKNPQYGIEGTVEKAKQAIAKAEGK